MKPAYTVNVGFPKHVHTASEIEFYHEASDNAIFTLLEFRGSYENLPIDMNGFLSWTSFFCSHFVWVKAPYTRVYLKEPALIELRHHGRF